MEVILAKTSGFCMGVKRAMQIAIETAENNKNVYTCGPLIHNPQAIEHLYKCGVKTLSDWKSLNDGTIIIRAHGMPSSVIEEIRQTSIGVVDATCPHVVTSQRKIKKFSDDGYFVYIIGDPHHPEMLSLQSFAPHRHKVVANYEEAVAENPPDKIMIIAQTTYNAKEFIRISEYLKKKSKNAVVCNSICLATFERQEEIRNLAANVDAVIVVGGKSSANTRRLTEIASSLCTQTWHIETAKELESVNFSKIKKLAVTAGASTPDFITQQVIDFLRALGDTSPFILA